MEINNPFMPVFGRIPALFIGRDRLLRDVVGGLRNGPNDPNRTTVFTGPRGSGKTVMLTKIAAEAQALGWVCANVMTRPGMLERVLEQVRDGASEILPVKANKKLAAIEISTPLGGVGVATESVSEKTPSWAKQMTELLNALQEHGTGVLITVDEANAEVEDLIDMIAEYQLFVRAERDIALIVAGLPWNVDALVMDSTVSFFRRAFRHELKPIAIPDVRSSLKKTIEAAGRSIDAGALDEMAEATGGYPLMIQLIGYHVWNQSEKKKIEKIDLTEGIESARADLENMILDATLLEISDTDKKFLVAMLPDARESSIADIAERMGVGANYAAKYRRRLIKQGVIAPAGRGKVIYAIPMFKELLAEHYAEEGL
jgi:type II secretory pathway predicted ATPase ExeA